MLQYSVNECVFSRRLKLSVHIMQNPPGGGGGDATLNNALSRRTAITKRLTKFFLVVTSVRSL